MIKADFNKGEVEIKGNSLDLCKEFVAIYYALEKTNPDLLDAAVYIIEKQTADGLGADVFIKKVKDMHGLG